MRRFLIPLALAASVLSAGGVRAAQDWPDEYEEDERPRRLDISLGLGRLRSSDWSDLVVLGTLGGLVERVLVRDIAVDPGTSVDLAVTYWEGRYGFRVHAGFARSCLAIATTCGPRSLFVDDDDLDDDVIALLRREVDVTSWLLDIGGAVSLVRPHADREFRPYVFFGIGSVAYDLDGPVGLFLPTFLELAGARGRLGLDLDDNVIIVTDGSPFLVSVDEPGFEVLLAGAFGIGADVRVPIGEGSIGLRFELADHISRSPLDVRLAGLVDDFHFSRRDLDDVRFDFGTVHNLRFSIGLVVDAPLRGPPAEPE